MFLKLYRQTSVKSVIELVILPWALFVELRVFEPTRCLLVGMDYGVSGWVSSRDREVAIKSLSDLVRLLRELVGQSVATYYLTVV